MATVTLPPTRRDAHRHYAEERGFAAAEWRALGTTAHLVVTELLALDAARVAVESVLDDIDRAASRFRADSELSAVNRADGRPTPVSPLLMRALRVALDAAEWTGGLVDPTVGASLVGLGYDRTFTLVPASGPAVTVRVGAAPGWQHVVLDEDAMTVTVPAGTVLDLGATAKGFAADLAADAAAAAAGCGVLVNLGGDLSLGGRAPRDGWPVTVGDTSSLDVPVGAEAEQVVVLRSGALATSSTRARRWRRGGSELHHIVDPRSGLPSAGTYRTVSVTAATCALANAASTAAVILGAEAPAWLARRGLPARLVTASGEVQRTSGWPEPEEAP